MIDIGPIKLKFCQKLPLTDIELAALKGEFITFVQSMAFQPPDFRCAILGTDQKGLMEYLMYQLLPRGIDPL
jgi:hypothetical protein